MKKSAAGLGVRIDLEGRVPVLPLEWGLQMCTRMSRLDGSPI